MIPFIRITDKDGDQTLINLNHVAIFDCSQVILQSAHEVPIAPESLEDYRKQYKAIVCVNDPPRTGRVGGPLP